MTMKLYHCPQTRAFTALWMMEEAGEPYEIVRVNIPLPDDLVEAIDRYADAQGLTRSGFLARAARKEPAEPR